MIVILVCRQTNIIDQVPFAPHPQQCLFVFVFCCFFFLVDDTLSNKVRKYLIVLWDFVFLNPVILSIVFFLCIYCPTYISSFMSFISFAHFLTQLLVLLLFSWTPSIFWILLLYWMHKVQISYLLMISWLCKSVLDWQNPFVNFCFYCLSFWGLIQEIFACANVMQWYACVSIKLIQALDLELWATVSWFLYRVSCMGLVSNFWMWKSYFSNTICWRYCHLSREWF